MKKNTKLTRRDFLRLSGLMGGATLLAACAPQTTPTEVAETGGEEVVEAAVEEKVHLTFWTPGGSDVYCKGFDTINEEYMVANPNIVMEQTQCNPTGENYTEVLLANIAAGTPPDATIVWNSPVAYAVRGAVIPLDEYMRGSKYSQEENWPKGVLASCQYEGKTYGLPVAAGTYAMFYNEELFENKGFPINRDDFPKTWDELRRYSKEFTVWEGDLLTMSGFHPWGGPGDFYGQAVEFPIWSHTNGGKVYDPEENKYYLDSEQHIEMFEYALDWWKEMYNSDLIKVQTSANWGGYADGEGRPPAFQEGIFAIHNNGFWFCSDMYAAEMKMTRWNVADYPVGPSGKESASGYWPNWLVIPKNSPNVKEAFDYIDSMSAIGIQTWFSNIPDLPTNANVPDTLVPALVVENRGQEVAEDVTNFFRHQLDISVPMWNSPVEDFYLDNLSLAIENILAGAKTPAEALGEAQTACQAELDKVIAG